MKKLIEACKVAIEMQKKTFGENSVETRINRIRETDDCYLIDFQSRFKGVPTGSYGCELLVYKNDMSAIRYSPPSYPENIFEILDAAKEINIPQEYA